MRQEGLHPIYIGRQFWLGLVSSGHPQQVADPHRFQFVTRLAGGLIGKEFVDGIVKAQFSFGDGKPHCRRCETLAQ